LHWFVEISLNDALERQHWPKSKLISAVVSNKQSTVGHRRRFKLMQALKDHFGDRLDWFGRGVQELGAVKAKGLLDYKYHIVLENGSWPHYWTEKLADAFVANCFPFYWGAPNISDYFEKTALRTIDVNDPEGTIRDIEQAIAADEYGRKQDVLARSRRRVLIDHHPYGSYLRALSQLPRGEVTEIAIRPSNEFCFSLRERLARKLHRMATRRAT
jgi:hypothetical protein